MRTARLVQASVISASLCLSTVASAETAKDIWQDFVAKAAKLYRDSLPGSLAADLHDLADKRIKPRLDGLSCVDGNGAQNTTKPPKEQTARLRFIEKVNYEAGCEAGHVKVRLIGVVLKPQRK
jgi:hypothetical protein